MFDKSEKTSLFIDGSSLYYASRNLGFDVDYKMILKFFQSETHLMRAYYYVAIPESDEYSPLKPLTDWLAYNGYALVTKSAREFTDHYGRRRVKGNMDVEIAVDLMEQAEHLDHAIIFSGDSDLRRVTEAIQRLGVRVTVVSSLRSGPSLVGDELRRQVDQFIELGDIAENFTRCQEDSATQQRSSTGRLPREAALEGVE